jgi:hypothetical protein
MVVNLPPELVDKLASHDPMWWAQPLATFIAGCGRRWLAQLNSADTPLCEYWSTDTTVTTTSAPAPMIASLESIGATGISFALRHKVHVVDVDERRTHDRLVAGDGGDFRCAADD